MEKWKAGGSAEPDLRYSDQPSSLESHVAKITFVINLRSSSRALGNQPHDQTPPPPPISIITWFHTVTQFTHLHLAARTLPVRTPKVLHTLEYGTPRSLTSLVMEAVAVRSCVSVRCIVYDWVCCVFFLCRTMPYGLYLHLSPKDAFHNQM